MEIRPNDVGRLVELPIKTDWGPGKIVKIENGYAFIHFRDDGDKMAKKYPLGDNPLKWAANQSDPVLDRLNPSSTRKPRNPSQPGNRLEFSKALDLFKAKYPLGFNDPAYLGAALDRDSYGRKYASRLFQDLFGDGRLEKMLENRDHRPLADNALALLEAQNLLGKDELKAFREVLGNVTATLLYFDALNKVLKDGHIIHDCMHPYFQTVLSGPVTGFAKWPDATLLPFLAQPARHMFLKPQVTKAATAALGAGFLYEPKLGWRTYHSLLVTSAEVLEKLKPLGARDFLDVQAFLAFVQEAAKVKTPV